MEIVLRDRDSKYTGAAFDDKLEAAGVRVTKVGYRAPNMNAYVERFEKNKDPYWASRVLYACLPTADSLADIGALIPLAQIADKGKPDARVLGAALYRNKKYPEAIASLKAATQNRAWDNLFLAMAHHRVGNAEKAREHLKIAVQRIEESGYPWNERTESEALLREAEALIKGTGDDPGPKKK